MNDKRVVFFEETVPGQTIEVVASMDMSGRIGASSILALAAYVLRQGKRLGIDLSPNIDPQKTRSGDAEAQTETPPRVTAHVPPSAPAHGSEGPNVIRPFIPSPMETMRSVAAPSASPEKPGQIIPGAAKLAPVAPKPLPETARPVVPAKTEASPATQGAGDRHVMAPAPAPVVPGAWATEVRRNYLRHHYPTEARSQDIHTALSMLEGPQMPLLSVVQSYANVVLGLKRGTPQIKTEKPADASPTLADVVNATMANDAPRLDRGLTALNGPPKPNLETKPAAAPTVSAITAATGDPVLASRETIQRWGEERGIITGKLDIEQVNSRRRKLGLPLFQLRAG